MTGRSVDFIEVKITSKKNFQKSVLRKRNKRNSQVLGKSYLKIF